MLPRILALRALGAHTGATSPILVSAHSQIPLQSRPALKTFSISAVRWATHKASRPANGGKDGPGKRLGAKKTAGELVKTGMIIYKQRGTVWFPGENALMGRDHTIHAACPGYVQYYRDRQYPTRKYIGIALRQGQKLPTPPNAVTRRRLGRAAVPLVEIQRRDTLEEKEREVLKSGIYYYRPANWKLGLMAQELKKPYDAKDTWARWQKRAKRVAFAKARKGMSGKESKGKKKQKAKRKA